MAKEPAAGPNRASWHIGPRVSRKDTNELGTVAQTDGMVKVKWDGGRTSYFDHAIAANVQLKPAEPE
jgi:hypothetical protein